MIDWLGKRSGWLDLFLQSNCAVCERPASSGLCQDCQRQIKRCQFPDPDQFWQEPLPVFAWGLYGGALKRAIAALKYNNHPQLARPLGHWLAQTWLDSSASAAQNRQNLVVVPIPLHPDKQKQRGFNQAALLAEAFCERTGLPLQRQGLTRSRATEALFNLSPEARQQALTGAFQIGQGLLHRRSTKTVLLLDDIYTTGATVGSAIQTLQHHGIAVCGVTAIAKTGVKAGKNQE